MFYVQGRKKDGASTSVLDGVFYINFSKEHESEMQTHLRYKATAIFTNSEEAKSYIRKIENTCFYKNCEFTLDEVEYEQMLKDKEVYYDIKKQFHVEALESAFTQCTKGELTISIVKQMDELYLVKTHCNTEKPYKHQLFFYVSGIGIDLDLLSHERLNIDLIGMFTESIEREFDKYIDNLALKELNKRNAS